MVKLCKDLTATTERSYNERTTKGSVGGYNHGSQGKSGGGGGLGAGKEHGKDKVKKSRGPLKKKQGYARLAPRQSHCPEDLQSVGN